MITLLYRQTLGQTPELLTQCSLASARTSWSSSPSDSGPARASSSTRVAILLSDESATSRGSSMCSSPASSPGRSAKVVTSPPSHSEPSSSSNGVGSDSPPNGLAAALPQLSSSPNGLERCCGGVLALAPPKSASTDERASVLGWLGGRSVLGAQGSEANLLCGVEPPSTESRSPSMADVGVCGSLLFLLPPILASKASASRCCEAPGPDRSTSSADVAASAKRFISY
mmetsp:Transcript_22445/g.75792  ORF Transcript_22445/g.75792 Transcript_22445/m.75792 type:complete len:228 (+) Transcript_22445:151-834(+)